MSKMISAGKTPKIKVDVIGGDVSVVGWDGDILVKGDDEEIHIQQNGEAVALSCEGDLALRVPKGASFEFGNIGGDASIRGVQGDVFLRHVGGDLSIREAGRVTIDTIGADFSLRNAHGDVHVRSAGGDVSIRDAGGKVILDSVANDLTLRGARGDVKVNVGEDVIVYLDPRPDTEYAVVAGDDILLVIPPAADATLTMKGDRIDVDLPGVEPDEDATERVVVLGSGSAKISLSAGGDVRVSSREDAAEYAEEFGNFAGMNFDFSGWGDRISKHVEEAARRAAKRTEEAMRRAERHARRGRATWNWTWDTKGAPKPPVPPATPSEPVTDAERMMILKMLAEKKITAEQAEELLTALEGGK